MVAATEISPITTSSQMTLDEFLATLNQLTIDDIVIEIEVESEDE